MTLQYQVQFSEDDLFHIEGDYGRMHGNILPTPDSGHYLVKTDGVYEIAHVAFSLDNHFDVFLRPLVTQIQDGDIIVVHNKERYYKFYNRDDGCGFRKVTLLTLMNTINGLEEKNTKLQKEVTESKERLALVEDTLKEMLE